jgi:sugar lactone lactonase YvrE
MPAMTSAWTRITPEPDLLGESPFWHPQEQCLYWVDIPGRRVARVKVDGLQPQGAVEYWPLDEEPGCIAPVQGGGLVLALRSGICLAPTWGRPLQPLAAAPYDTRKLRFNDGKCDAQGRLWAGTMYEPRDQKLGVLYRLDATGLQAVMDGVTTANGLAWSPDGRTAYWADTAAHRVRAFDVDPASGQLSGERLFHQMAPKPEGWTWGSATPYGGRPDGAAVDAEGCYWSAQFEGGRLLRLSPAGEVLAQVSVPALCPTMPCFGGPDFKTLFITTARQGRSPEELAHYPDAGCVFAMRVEVAGLPVHFWRNSVQG